MPTIFTRIINGEIPGRFVWRDEKAVAFLSKDPLKPGHTLVVPVEEVDHWLDASPPLLAHLTEVAQKLGKALQRAYQPTKVGMMIAGLEVPHLHIHLVPIDGVHDMDFANARRDAPDDELAAAQEKIEKALGDVSG